MNRLRPRKLGHCLFLIIAMSLYGCGGSGSEDSSLPPVDNPPAPPPVDPPVDPPAVPPVALADATTDHAFSTDHFTGSANCSSCHDGIRDADGTDVSIVADWQPGMMANSSRDPFWRAKVASEVRRNPGLQEEIEGTCSRCHTPMAHVEAEFEAAQILLFGTGFLHPDNALFDAAADGVSCTLCHQIADSAELGTVDGFSGQFEIAYNAGIDRELFGQYDDPFASPMINQVGFTPAGSAHIASSEVCATCHNLFTPIVDAAGNLTNDVFPEQSVYTEWENSDYADTMSCVDCHLPSAVGDVQIATRPMNALDGRPDFSQHLIAGGNTYMLDLIARNADTLSVTATGFDEMVDGTRALLGVAAEVSLEAVARFGDDLGFTVRVVNNSGHKLPTSYPSRRAWLHVQITDAVGSVVFESGAIDASGRIAGLNSDADLTTLEPHHRTITSGEQVQSYEALMEDRDGNLTYTLLEAAIYRKDNRLLPLGMDKTIVPVTIRPCGDAADDPNFGAGGDLVDFRIPGLDAGTYAISVRLNYQTLAYGHAQDLFRDADDPYVARFQALNESAQVRFETIGSASDSIDF